MDWWSTFWTACAAIATFTAAGVATWAVIVALNQGKKASEQFLQARYDYARPILIVTGTFHIKMQQHNPTCMVWEEPEQKIYVCNVGKAVALQVRGVIFAPEAVIVGPETAQPSLENVSQYHWSYLRADTVQTIETVQPGKTWETEEAGNKTLTLLHDEKEYAQEIRDKKGKAYPLNAPSHTFPSYYGEPARRFCRVTLTYMDIFHRKHASIFDLVHNSGWQEVAILDDIPEDLENLRKGK